MISTALAAHLTALFNRLRYAFIALRLCSHWRISLEILPRNPVKDFSNLTIRCIRFYLSAISDASNSVLLFLPFIIKDHEKPHAVSRYRYRIHSGIRHIFTRSSFQHAASATHLGFQASETTISLTSFFCQSVSIVF